MGDTLFCLQLGAGGTLIVSSSFVSSRGPQKWCAAIKQESAGQTWQNSLRNGNGESPAGLSLMEAAVLYIAFCTTTRDSSSSITSRPVNTLSVGFSECARQTLSGHRVCASITPPALCPVETCLTWCIDVVRREYSSITCELGALWLPLLTTGLQLALIYQTSDHGHHCEWLKNDHKSSCN